MAGGLVLRFPTGSVDRLRGTGEYEVMPALYASSRTWHAASWAQLSLHLNLGVDVVTGDLGQSEGRWGIGCDWGVTERATMGLAFLGRHPFQPPVESFLRPYGCFPAPGRHGALFGLTGDRPDYYDMSIGAAPASGGAACLRQRVVPLNDAGVRTGVIPPVGVEVAL